MTASSEKPQRAIRFDSGISMEIQQGDITRVPADVIVNAANTQLRHGGGVAGAIARSGGPLIQQESDAWIAQFGPIDHQHPAYTSAGKLPCQYVIHAAGPIWGEGDEDRKLADTISSALVLADHLQAASISFPAISTGIFGFPADRAAEIFMRSFWDYAQTHPGTYLKRILMVLYDMAAVDIFINAFDAFHWKE
jgi:O-acetyl-ADP-ribose deacetylase (regulator of RNase III)